jgi:hypothetical protein
LLHEVVDQKCLVGLDVRQHARKALLSNRAPSA